jgi:3-oxoadipate enol-lactonase
MPTVCSNDVELYYEMAGQGPPLLLIHGLGSSARDWELQVPAFAERYRVVAYDVRGHGRSEKPRGPYSVPLFAADAAGLIQALPIAPAHVVGISMGGMIGLQLAVSAPELVRSLVVANAGPELVARTVGQRLQVWQRRLIVRLLGMRTMGRVLAGRLFPAPDQAELRHAFAERWAENDPRAYADAMRGLVGWIVVDQLGAIRCPTLILAADQDYTPVATKQALADRIPDAELVVIEDSRHATPVERPEAFNAAVLTFLAKQG